MNTEARQNPAARLLAKWNNFTAADEQTTEQLNSRDTTVLVILVSLVVVYMVFGTLTSQKIITILGFSLSAASIWFSLLTFPVTDTICNEFGKSKAHLAVFVGWGAMLIATVMANVTAALPAATSFTPHEETFDFLMTHSVRFVFVATFSFIIAQLLDNEIFHFLKTKTDGKYLWLRNNVSTAISQSVNTAIFVTGLFWGARDFMGLLELFVATMVFKLAIALFDTPLLYLATFLVRKARGTVPAVLESGTAIDGQVA